MLQPEKDYYWLLSYGAFLKSQLWEKYAGIQIYRPLFSNSMKYILKELLKHIFVQNICLLQSFSFFNFTYIIHKAKENNNGTNKISWSFSLQI